MERFAYIPPSTAIESFGLDLADWMYPLDVNQFNAEHSVYIPDQTNEWLEENYFFKINPAPLPPLDVINTGQLIITKYVIYNDIVGYFAQWDFKQDEPNESDMTMDEEEILLSNRYARNRKLLLCDYTQASDSPLTDSKKAEWATYRQQLRDLPTSLSTFNTLLMDENAFPTEPS